MVSGLMSTLFVLEMVYSSLVDLDPSIDSRLSHTLSSTSLPVELVSNALLLVEALLNCEHGMCAPTICSISRIMSLSRIPRLLRVYNLSLPPFPSFSPCLSLSRKNHIFLEPLKNKLRESKEIVSSLDGLTKHSAKDIHSRALGIFTRLSKWIQC